MSSEPRQEDRPHGHQMDRLSVRWIVLFGIALLALVFVLQVGLAVTLHLVIPQRPLVHVNQEWRDQRIGPRVQPNQAYDRVIYEKQQDAVLDSYGWQDPGHQIARIPIDHAIELMSQRQMRVDWPSSTEENSEPTVNDRALLENAAKGETP